MNKLFVSVIIPVFNDRNRLGLCLQSLEKQNYPKHQYEVIVVDNGSSVDIQSFIKQFNQTKFIYEAKTGSYAARNKGIAIAKGEILAFTDADCIPSNNWIKKGVDHLTRIENGGLIAGRIDVFPRIEGKPTFIELYDISSGFPQERYIKERHFSVTANLITTKNIFKKVGRFNPQLKSGGDLEFGLRAYREGIVQVYANDVVVKHPARYSIFHLFNQATRVAGGRYQLLRDDQSGKLTSSRDTQHNRQYFTPLSTIGKSLKAIWGMPRLSILDKLSLIGIAFSLRCISILERIRLSLGGKAIR